MKKYEQDIAVAQERLEGLRRRAERIVTDTNKPRRVKDMELAGINGTIEQLESEARALVAAGLREQVDALRTRLRRGDAKDLGEVLDGALGLVEQLAEQRT